MRLKPKQRIRPVLKMIRNICWKKWASITVLGVLVACNYDVGECYRRTQQGEVTGLGGGTILFPGSGGFGDIPPDPSDESDEESCNATEQPPPPDGPAPDSNGSPVETGLKIFCTKADMGITCSTRCYAKGIACGPVAAHPYKSDAGTGLLFSCNDLLIGFMCGYHYANGDDCYYPIGTPFPKTCSYSGND